MIKENIMEDWEKEYEEYIEGEDDEENDDDEFVEGAN